MYSDVIGYSDIIGNSDIMGVLMDWCPINFPSRVPNGMALSAFRMASPGTGDHGDRYIGSLFRVDVPFPDDYLQWLGMAAGKLHAE